MRVQTAVARKEIASLRSTMPGARMLKIAPSNKLLLPIYVPLKLLMGPGPSNVPPRVLAAGALPALGHLHPEFLQVNSVHACERLVWPYACIYSRRVLMIQTDRIVLLHILVVDVVQ